MRSALSALSAELKRLKAAGVKSVPISEEGLAALRQAVAARRRGAVASGEGAVAREAAPAVLPRSAPRPAPASAPRPEAGIPPPAVVELPPGDKPTRWAALRDRVLNDATCLAHVRSGKKVVFGVGRIDAQIMFVGEAPGAEEEVQGEPFVGPAGQLLTRMIAGMGLQRADVYIGNIMNWRPEIPGTSGVQYGNRPPTEQEMAYCLPFLKAQIEVVNPALLVALGATAAQGLLGFGTFRALGDVRGRWHEFAGKPLMVTYHPSYILRNPTNRSKRLIWEDLLKVMERGGLPISEKQRGYFLEK
ncbi:MAG TPA: uracil-DNA glycosylase [Opitutaceae bacterium]|nr:uracil-DNA glycosylase [Opitutaceae bacterium]